MTPALGGSGKIGLKIAHLDHDDILGVKRRAGGLVLLGAAKLRTRRGDDDLEVALGDNGALAAAAILVKQTIDHAIHHHGLAGHAAVHGTHSQSNGSTHARLLGTPRRRRGR